MSGEASARDAAHCRSIVRRHARTFWLASHFLPAEKRRATFALYAFCRVADDMVDLSPRDRTAAVTAMLADYRQRLAEALAGDPGDAVFREVAWAARRYGVPAPVLFELLDGIARDCAPASYATWDELTSYCEGVASSVGEMCTYVFGAEGGPDAQRRARTHARTLGVAMQLTNILRDVGEDARGGRCYLPDADLRAHGLSSAEVLAGEARLGRDERWRALMAFEIARARSLYESAMPGIALLSPDSRRCATACATGYASILRAIEEQGYDTFTRRASLGAMARAGVLLRALRVPAGPSSVAPRGGAEVTWA